MKKRSGREHILFIYFISAILLALPGCFSRLNVAPPYSMKIDPREYQPVVLLPILSAPDHPESGAALFSFIRDRLEGKGYILVKEADVSAALEELRLTPLLLLSDPARLIEMGQRLKAKLLVIGTIPEYKVQKSQWGPYTYQVWDQPFEYATLPTYYHGTCQIKMILRMFESEKGELVWAAEGNIRAFSASGELYAQKLAERLLQGLPSASLPPEQKK